MLLNKCSDDCERMAVLEKALLLENPSQVVLFGKLKSIENAPNAEVALKRFMKLTARVPVSTKMVSALLHKCEDVSLKRSAFERMMWYKEVTVNDPEFWIKYLYFERSNNGNVQAVYSDAMKTLNEKHLVHFTNAVALSILTIFKMEQSSCCSPVKIKGHQRGISHR
ncbi:hypothetical protein ACOME3_006054 [Neoechinorhynchus agilis]